MSVKGIGPIVNRMRVIVTADTENAYRTLDRFRWRLRWFWHDAGRTLGETLPSRLAWRLPRRLVFWCFVRVASETFLKTNQPPDTLTYPMMHDAWKTGPIRDLSPYHGAVFGLTDDEPVAGE